MAKYLAFDLAVELKEEADHRAQTPTARKRSRPGEGITKVEFLQLLNYSVTLLLLELSDD